MTAVEVREARPRLKALVREASHALARLDAARLEELGTSCAVLNRALPSAVTAGEAHEAQAEMAMLERVLEATRANLEVINRLREVRAGRIEYSARPLCGHASEGRYGND